MDDTTPRMGAQHERPFDLSWIELDGLSLRCALCRERTTLEQSPVLASVIAGMFIEQHAPCGASAARRAPAPMREIDL